MAITTQQKTVRTRTVQPNQSTEMETVSTQGDNQDSTVLKVTQIIWYFGHLVAILLFLRFIFLLLGANMTGLVLFIYRVSSIFILPFSGIFPSPRTGEFFFDSASLIGIIIYYLLVYLITKALVLFFSRSTTEQI